MTVSSMFSVVFIWETILLVWSYVKKRNSAHGERLFGAAASARGPPYRGDDPGQGRFRRGSLAGGCGASGVTMPPDMTSLKASSTVMVSGMMSGSGTST
jgi:hypothetical protein